MGVDAVKVVGGERRRVHRDEEHADARWPVPEGEVRGVVENDAG